MASNQASAAVGVAMVVAGMGLWGVATQAQVQRTRASEPATSPAASSAPRAPCLPRGHGHRLRCCRRGQRGGFRQRGASCQRGALGLRLARGRPG